MADATLRINADTRSATRALGRLQATLGALVSVAAIKSIAAMADTFQQVNARLRLATGGGREFIEVQKQLNTLSQETRSGLQETTDLYSRLARSTTESNVTTQQLLTATEAINKAMKVSGASTMEMNSAIIQLGQGLASGALRGDELRSVLENTPRLAQAIAKGLGVSIGQLRQLGTEGKLTTEVVLGAINSQANEIRDEFSKIPPTIADAFTELNNQMMKSTEELNRAGFGSVLTGIAKGAGDIVQSIAQAMREILPEQDLANLARRVRLGMVDVTIALLKGVDDINRVISPVFDGVKAGINNLVAFFNQLPSGIQTLGIIGFLLIGRSAKIIITIIMALARDVARIFDSMISGLYEIQNAAIRAINKIYDYLGKEPMPLLDYDPNMMENALKDIGFVNTILDETGIKLKEIGDEEKKNDSLIKATIKSLEQRRAVLAKPLPNQITGGGARTSTPSVPGPRIDTSSSKEYDRMLKKIRRNGQAVIDSLLTLEEQEQQSFQKRLQNLTLMYQHQLITATQFENNLFKLNEDRLLREQQLIIDKYDLEKSQFNRLQRLKEIAYARDLKKQGFSASESEEIAKNRVDFEKKSELEKAQFAIQQGATVFNELGKYNKRAFEAAKAFNIANAIMNTYTGATKALSMYPPPFNFIAAAAVIAMGLGQVAAIRSQQYSGRALGGPVMAGESYVVGENGPELFTPQVSGGITPNTALEPGITNINFNIQTNDARGFDQLLAERKPMIVNMIRTAQADRGSRTTL